MNRPTVAYHKDAMDEPVVLDRDIIDNPQRTESIDDYFVGIVDSFLFTSHGEILLQQRHYTKSINPSLLHTPIGGHIDVGDSPQFAFFHESVEEIGAAPYICVDVNEFDYAVKKMENYMHKTAICYEHDILLTDGEVPRFVKEKKHIYFGVYDGPLVSEDKSSMGFVRMSLDHLDTIISPDTFTDSFMTFYRTYRDDWQVFVNTYCTSTR